MHLKYIPHPAHQVHLAYVKKGDILWNIKMINDHADYIVTKNRSVNLRSKTVNIYDVFPTEEQTAFDSLH